MLTIASCQAVAARSDSASSRCSRDRRCEARQEVPGGLDVVAFAQMMVEYWDPDEQILMTRSRSFFAVAKGEGRFFCPNEYAPKPW